jgi:hypothetical protein
VKMDRVHDSERVALDDEFDDFVLGEDVRVLGLGAARSSVGGV